MKFKDNNNMSWKLANLGRIETKSQWLGKNSEGRCGNVRSDH